MVSVISTKSLVSTERMTTELEETMDLTPVDACEDLPIGWYDIFGRNCEWYSEDESNCEIYGNTYTNPT